MEFFFLHKCPVTGFCDYGNECSGFLTVGTSWISIVATDCLSRSDSVAHSEVFSIVPSRISLYSVHLMTEIEPLTAMLGVWLVLQVHQQEPQGTWTCAAQTSCL